MNEVVKGRHVASIDSCNDEKLESLIQETITEDMFRSPQLRYNISVPEPPAAGLFEVRSAEYESGAAQHQHWPYLIYEAQMKSAYDLTC